MGQNLVTTYVERKNLMTTFNWIDDADLESALRELQGRVDRAWSRAPIRQRQNVIDPVRTILLAAASDATSVEELAMRQQFAAAAQGITTALGHFHHHILASVPNWERCAIDGVQVQSASRRILATVQNKHNTRNAAAWAGATERLVDAVEERNFQDDDEWVGFIVTVIPHSPQRYSHRVHEEPSVTEMDGVSFYERVTGDPDALYGLIDHMIWYFGLEPEMEEYVVRLVERGLPPR